jgi:DNA (cytosine-5)-methyltransferase 1
MKAGGKSGAVMLPTYCLTDQDGQRMDCTEDQSGTLRAQSHGHEPLVFENHGIDARYTGPHEVSPTMSARYGTGGNNTPLVAEETAWCITGNAIDMEPQNGGNGLGIDENIAFTLTATDHHAVFSRQRTDLFKPDEIASTESARQ